MRTAGGAATGKVARLVAVVAAAAALALAGCHEPDRLRTVQATAALSTDTLDFGEVPVGEWRELDVRVRNIGYTPFHVVEALKLGDNPAFVVELPEGGRVGVGEERLVRVKFHPLREGSTEDALRVRHDADTGAEGPVKVRGLGTPTQVRVEPDTLDFETLEVDSDRVMEVRITNPVDLPLVMEVDGFEPEPYGIDTVTLAPFESRVVKARFHPRDLGRRRARIEIRSCDDCTPSLVHLRGNSVPSAFEFDPAPVAFEQIPVHERTRSKTRARNITWRPVDISQLRTSDRSFQPVSALGGRTVNPGEAVDVDVDYAARYSGPATAVMSVDYTSDKARNSDVLLDASGGAPTIAVAPVALDFGEIPAGGKHRMLLRISNAGSKGNLRFTGVRGVSGNVARFGVGRVLRGTTVYPWAAGSAWPNMNVDGVEIAPGTDSIDLEVTFEPDSAGSFEAVIGLTSSDQFTPVRNVTVTGRARSGGPCVYELKPQPVLDFGKLQVGRGAVLGFYFKNVGPAECAVKDVHLSNDGGGAFVMPGGVIPGLTVPYDTAFSAMIAFRPPTAGAFQGELRLTVNNPSYPTVTLPLKGVGAATCLVATPAYVDFGPIRYDCAAPTRRTLIQNQCTQPITVGEVSLGNGTSEQFSLLTPLTGPRTLAPTEGFELEFSYARNVHGQHYTPVYIQADSEPEPLMVPLLAETNHEGLQIDRFVQGTDSQLDVLFVVSNTTTMDTYQRRLADALPGFLDGARAAGVDVRVGVTTTGLVARGNTCPGGASGGEAGRLFPADGSRRRVVSSTQTDAGDVLRQNVEVGLCHNLVQGLETMRAALSDPLISSSDDPRTPLPNDGNRGFLRATARLAVVFVADEDDHSGFEPRSYIEFLQTLKGPGSAHRVQLYGLVPTDNRCTTAGASAPRVAEVAQATGGAVASVCEGEYGSFLARLVQRADGPQADFALTATPNGTDEMRVSINGTTQARERWTYEPTPNAVVFRPDSIPATGQNITVRYRAVCPAR